MSSGSVAPYPAAARELLRDSLLDAAGELLRERSWSGVTMAEVARATGVSRQTLYNEFGSRGAFAQAYVLREGDRFMEAVEAAVTANRQDPETAISAAFDVFLDGAAENPLVRAVLAADGENELLPLVTTRGQPLLERVTQRLANVIESCWPQIPGADAMLLSACLVRLAISHVALPEGSSDIDGAAVRRVFAPFVRQLFAEALAPRK